MRQNNSHTFVVLAYKESPFLEACIESLINQSLKSNIIIATSTPCQYINSAAEKFSLEVKINPIAGGIAPDWTFAYQCGQTEYLTLAHQDDYYGSEYTKLMLNAAESSGRNLITFCDYSELRNDKEVHYNLNLLVKRLMLTPYFLLSRNINQIFLKRLLLSFGSPVCCPSVMYNKKNIGDFSFSEDFSINLDWDAWLRFASQTGTFTYVGSRLMKHRVHTSSETTAGLRDGKRQAEDLRIFRRIWPEYLADQLARIYSLSYGSNS